MEENQQAVLIHQLKGIISQVRTAAVRNINALQVTSNYLIGKQIVEFEQVGAERAEYGKGLLKALSNALATEFGKGYSHSNLAYMRNFYLLYADRTAPKFQTVSGKLLPTLPDEAPYFPLSWSHYVFLMSISNAESRTFYEIEATQGDWSLRELKRQFNSSLYERLALSRDKAGVRKLALQGQLITEPKDVIKNPYVLEFLELDEKNRYSEYDLETAIIDKLEHFLLELGKGFLFEARQKRFTFDDDHYFVDLVFYNRLLRCYTIIDLKIGEITHQDLGQMQMYVNYYDRMVKLDSENPTIGIILCKKNKEALVEITLPKDSNIHASEYQLYLPSKEELQKQLEKAQQDWENNQ
jgi:predicted nuclease of restriction endonuclease-like (RecB) superfamily